jgi:hypothetical protein
MMLWMSDPGSTPPCSHDEFVVDVDVFTCCDCGANRLASGPWIGYWENPVTGAEHSPVLDGLHSSYKWVRGLFR